MIAFVLEVLLRGLISGPFENRIFMKGVLQYHYCITLRSEAEQTNTMKKVRVNSNIVHEYWTRRQGAMDCQYRGITMCSQGTGHHYTDDRRLEYQHHQRQHKSQTGSTEAVCSPVQHCLAHWWSSAVQSSS